MLLTLVVRHGIHEKRDSPLQGRSSVYFLATVPSNQGSGSPEFGSPFPRIQAPKMPGARRRLRANGMTEYALTHQQLCCGSMTLPARTALLILKLF